MLACGRVINTLMIESPLLAQSCLSDWIWLCAVAVSGQVAINTPKLVAVGLLVVVEAVFFKPDDLNTKPVINLLDALQERCKLVAYKDLGRFLDIPG